MISHRLYKALGMETVLAFDVETTGLDSDKDEILEIGIVRTENGEIQERYTQLFRPSVPIPPVITQLTGIREEDCVGQPTVEEKFSEIVACMETGFIVAHNADFDFSFLHNAWKRYSPDVPTVGPSRILDTLELSRLLLPWLPNHRLGTVSEHLHVQPESRHRALADAETTSSIFRELLSMALNLDERAVAVVNRILEGSTDGLRFFFEKVSEVKDAYGSRRKRTKREGPSNTLGTQTERPDGTTVQRVDEEEVEEFFRAGGALSNALPQFEGRRPQQEMARAVGRMLNEEAFLMAEVGTGVGKSLAYLIPSMLYAARNPGCRIVVSTHTKTLQNQLFSKELPLLARIWEKPFMAVLLKGRGNYLCLNRWENMILHAQERLSLKQRRKLLPLVLWVLQTQTGDIEENNGFSLDQNREVWSQLNCEGSHCSGSECQFESACFFRSVRRASRAADFVVVNHSLLLSDVAAGYSVLGDYDTLLVDEAHQIERVASDCLSTVLTEWLFRDIAQRLHRTDPNEGGILLLLQNLSGKKKKHRPEETKLGETVERLKQESDTLWRAASRFFQALVEVMSSRVSERGWVQKLRIRSGTELFGPLAEQALALESALEDLEADLSDMISLIHEATLPPFSMSQDVERELDAILQRLLTLMQVFKDFQREDYGTDVVWCEMTQKQDRHEVRLHSVPLNVAGILTELLYPRLRRCLMTSATLAVGGGFDYFMHRLGIDCVDGDRVTARLFGSPFDYSEQSLLLIPVFLSNPRERRFTQDVARVVGRILSFRAKGTMILFTSHEMLREVYRTVRPNFNDDSVRLLAQGMDGSRTSLLHRFQEDEKSILFGTSSFWEGVDVPGTALEMLIMTKIPFDVPTEPLVEARMEQAQIITGNGFLNYLVPEAIIRLRQGFGRLIRSGKDRGVVILLDHRVVQTRYGSLFLESLPVEATVCEDEESLMEKLESWFS